MKGRYAVVRDALEFKFTKWHDTLEEATKEAERLCKKERVPFIIIREISFCQIVETPITWKWMDGIREERR